MIAQKNDFFKNTVDFIKKHKEIFILAGILTAFVILPLILLRIPSGHDYKYHMGRIYQISQNIENGQWFAPLYYGQINGHGYASPLFYGDIFLHIPGFLVTLGLTVEQGLRLYIVMCLAATCFVTYFCAKKITENSTSALVTTVLYTFSSYLCVDWITRVALGEVQAFIFIPIAFLGLYSIINKDSKYWLCLPLGLGGVLISHTLSAAVLAVFFAVYAFFHLGDIFKAPKRILLIVISAVLFFTVMAFYMFPMLEQLNGEPLRLTDGTTDTIWGTLTERSLKLFQTVSDFNLSTPNDEWIPNGIGLAIPISIAALIYFICKKRDFNASGAICSIFALICLFCATNLFPWDSVQEYLGKLQFPWRLLMFTTFFGAVGAGFVVQCFKNKQNASMFAVIIIFFSLGSYMITALPKLGTMIKYEKQDTVLAENWHDGLGGVEYLPSGTSWNTMIKKGPVTSTNDAGIRKSLKIEKEFTQTTVSFSGKASKNATIQFPLVMYKGYTAVDGDGNPVELSCNRGYVTAHVGGMENGVITVKYEGTTVQTVSKIVSAVAILLIIAYAVINRVKPSLFSKLLPEIKPKSQEKSSSEQKV